MATDTRQRIVEKAAELLQSGGYHATGIQRLTAGGDLPRGSLYFHFPGGKEELACAALAHAGQRLHDGLAQAFDAAPSTGDGLAVVLHLLGTRLVESQWRDGCPISTTTLEMASTSEAIRLTCAGIYSGWTSIIAERLLAEGFSVAHAEQLATVALAAIEGALLLARAQRSLKPLDAVAANLRGLVAR